MHSGNDSGNESGNDSGNDTGNGVAELLDETSIQVIGETVEDIGSLIKSDGAAISVSRALCMEDNGGCDMNDCDTFCCADISILIRSRNKVIVNAFKDC